MTAEENGRKPLPADPNAPISYKKELFYRYIANMKQDAEGNRVTMADFCRMVGLDNKTVYAWQKEPDFNEKVAEYVDEVYLRFLPKAAKINMAYATKGSFPHMNLIYKQSGRLKADKQEVKTELTVDAALDLLN